MSMPRIFAYKSSQSFQYLGLQNTPSKGPEPVYRSFLDHSQGQPAPSPETTAHLSKASVVLITKER